MLFRSLFGAPPAAAPAALNSNPMDLFASTTSAAPAAPVSTSSMDIFGAAPAQQQLQQPSSAPDLFGAPQPTFSAAAPVAQPNTISVPGPNHQGLSIEFECSKPEASDQQKSMLLAKFTNHTAEPIVGLNLQVAVPKYVKLEMQPPTSTTVPPGSNGKQVTQTIRVTNSMLGTKNLVLKLKLGFTAKGQKVDHMATQSGFPAGQY